jgi:hypothetical protein
LLLALNPNTIQGTIRFSNLNPEIVDLLNAQTSIRSGRLSRPVTPRTERGWVAIRHGASVVLSLPKPPVSG